MPNLTLTGESLLDRALAKADESPITNPTDRVAGRYAFAAGWLAQELAGVLSRARLHLRAAAALCDQWSPEAHHPLDAERIALLGEELRRNEKALR
jgi:hypothetical protein